jgi:predicted nucleic acid-binding protein
MIIVDTNVISETTKPTPSPAVFAWAEGHADDLSVTSVTVGELLTGVEMLPDGSRKRRLAEAIELILVRLAVPLPYDERAARVYADMRGLARRLGRGLSVEDGMIAAICAVNGATLATRNVHDFDFLPITLINPWETPEPSSKRG